MLAVIFFLRKNSQFCYGNYLLHCDMFAFLLSIIPAAHHLLDSSSKRSAGLSSAHGQWLTPNTEAERRKNVGKMDASVPEEREASNAFGTKESTIDFPEERSERLYFWRKGKMCSELREIFPATLARALMR